jgi:thioredoxin 2
MSTRLDSSGRSLEITCSGCNATNRVPLRRISDGPVCGRCRQRLAADRPVEVSDATFDPLVQEAAIPVLVDFWAPWCGPCRTVAPELEKLASEKQGELLVAKLNSDQNPQVSSRYNVRSIPTLVLFRAGQEERRVLGAMRAPQILTQLGL